MLRMPSGFAFLEQARTLLPHTVVIRATDAPMAKRLIEARTWCNEQVGPCIHEDADGVGLRAINQDGVWSNIGLAFRFRCPNAAFWFKVRWY